MERDGDASELSEGGLAVGDGVIPGEQGEVTERIAGCGEGTCAIQLERTRYTARHTGTHDNRAVQHDPRPAHLDSLIHLERKVIL